MSKKEQMIYARNQWEIARVESNPQTGKAQWIRRDSSYICDVGAESAVLEMPARPIKGKIS